MEICAGASGFFDFVKERFYKLRGFYNGQGGVDGIPVKQAGKRGGDDSVDSRVF